MRLGGPIFKKYQSPDEWVAVVRSLDYRAAYAPVGVDESLDTIRSYADASEKAGIVIAETGAWSNPLSNNADERNKAVERCRKNLWLADELGARCCVNISGSRGKTWAYYDKENYTAQTFDMIVAVVRDIIDAVKPKRSFYALETMPWIPPFSTNSYEQLLKAIDRKSFAVHFDPVNLVSNLDLYMNTGAMIEDFVKKLGAHIRSCHAKDTLVLEKLTLHIDETRPGLGNLDYETFLREINGLDPDTPVMLEHLATREEYDLAAVHLRTIAAKEGIKL